LNHREPDRVPVDLSRLVVIELKKPGVPARAAFDENLTHYKADIPQIFWFNALLVASMLAVRKLGQVTLPPCRATASTRSRTCIFWQMFLT
jgi:hypothetical protein